MSNIHNVSRFVAALALDFDLLEEYDDDPSEFFPLVEEDDDEEERAAKEELMAERRLAFGPMTEEDLAVLREGDFQQIFDYLLDNDPRVQDDDQAD